LLEFLEDNEDGLRLLQFLDPKSVQNKAFFDFLPKEKPVESQFEKEMKDVFRKKILKTADAEPERKN
jgi:hypothetical protein